MIGSNGAIILIESLIAQDIHNGQGRACSTARPDRRADHPLRAARAHLRLQAWSG
jgi:hypothetical protein